MSGDFSSAGNGVRYMKDETISRNVLQKPALGYGPIAAVVVAVGSYFAAQFIAGVLLSLLSPLLGWNSDRLYDWLSDSVAGQFAATIVVGVVTLFLILGFIKHRKTRLSDIGLVRPRLQNIGQAAAGYVFYMATFLLISFAVATVAPSVNMEQEQQIGFAKTTTGVALWLVFASLVLLPAFVEEVLTRGLLYTGLRSKLPKLLAAVITSLLFAAAHLQFGSGEALLWIAAIDTFVLSMILAYLREKTDSLWPPIMVHMAKNGVAFLFLFIVRP